MAREAVAAVTLDSCNGCMEVAGRARGPLARRSGRDRRLASRRAAECADTAIRRLQADLDISRKRYSVLASSLGAPQVGNRLAAVAPWLHALLEGREPSGLMVLARNVALHAKHVPDDIAEASAADLRFAQGGPRLDAVVGTFPERSPQAPAEDLGKLALVSSGVGAEGTLYRAPPATLLSTQPAPAATAVTAWSTSSDGLTTLREVLTAPLVTPCGGSSACCFTLPERRWEYVPVGVPRYLVIEVFREPTREDGPTGIADLHPHACEAASTPQECAGGDGGEQRRTQTAGTGAVSLGHGQTALGLGGLERADGPSVGADGGNRFAVPAAEPGYDYESEDECEEDAVLTNALERADRCAGARARPSSPPRPRPVDFGGGPHRRPARAHGVLRAGCSVGHDMPKTDSTWTYVCDVCSHDIPPRHEFFLCAPCDYSLCTVCSRKIALGDDGGDSESDLTSWSGPYQRSSLPIAVGKTRHTAVRRLQKLLAGGTPVTMAIVKAMVHVEKDIDSEAALDDMRNFLAAQARKWGRLDRGRGFDVPRGEGMGAGA